MVLEMTLEKRDLELESAKRRLEATMEAFNRSRNTGAGGNPNQAPHRAHFSDGGSDGGTDRGSDRGSVSSEKSESATPKRPRFFTVDKSPQALPKSPPPSPPPPLPPDSPPRGSPSPGEREPLDIDKSFDPTSVPALASTIKGAKETEAQVEEIEEEEHVQVLGPGSIRNANALLEPSMPPPSLPRLPSAPSQDRGAVDLSGGTGATRSDSGAELETSRTQAAGSQEKESQGAGRQGEDKDAKAQALKPLTPPSKEQTEMQRSISALF